VPYLTANKQVKRGTLISTLTLANDVTTRPDTHVALFAGEFPCHCDGSPIERIRNGTINTKIGNTVVANHTFSEKPKPSGYYESYYEKLSTYADILSGPVQSNDPGASAKT